jgi:hypothetical protein
MVCERNQTLLDRGKEPGMLPFTPIVEFRDLFDLESRQERVNIKGRRELVTHHFAGDKPIQVERHMSPAELDPVTPRLDCVATQLCPEVGNGGRHRPACAIGAGSGPEEGHQAVAADLAAIDRQYDQHREVLLDLDSHLLPTGGEETGKAQTVENKGWQLHFGAPLRGTDDEPER